MVKGIRYRDKPQPVPADKIRSDKQKYDSPACCNLAGLIIHWEDGHWWHVTDDGGYMQTYYCAFCGAKLTPETPSIRLGA